MRILAFTSGKGGCGKTTLALNFAKTIADSAAKRVLVVDLDFANRGSTGVFQQELQGRLDTLTLDSLLFTEGHLLDAISVAEVGAGVTFIPSYSTPTAEFSPRGLNARELADLLKRRLELVATRLNVALVVLDCFCGVDELTTAAALAADDVVIVNEVDIVTFTGSIALIRHLQKAAEQAEQELAIHVVINRLKGGATVRQVEELYRNNIEKVISESVLCHFPYNSLVVEGFGKFPFVKDLLPGSLFAEKLKLMAYLLFRGEDDDLLGDRICSWSKWRVRRLYFRSSEIRGADAIPLVRRFTQFPLQLGVLAVLWIVVFRLNTLTAHRILVADIAFALSLALMILRSLVLGCWDAGLQSVARGTFWLRYTRLRSGAKDLLAKRLLGLQGVGEGFLMVLGAGLITCCLAVGIICCVGYIDNSGIAANPASSPAERLYNIAVNSGARGVLFGGEWIDHRDDISAGSFSRTFASTLETRVSLRGIKGFTNCRFQSLPDFGKVISDIEFVNCWLPSEFPRVQVLRNIRFTACATPGRNLSFLRNVLENCTIDIGEPNGSRWGSAPLHFLILRDCEIKGQLTVIVERNARLMIAAGDRRVLPAGLLIKGEGIWNAVGYRELEANMHKRKFSEVCSEEEGAVVQMSASENLFARMERLSKAIELEVLGGTEEMTRRAEVHVRALRKLATSSEAGEIAKARIEQRALLLELCASIANRERPTAIKHRLGQWLASARDLAFFDQDALSGIREFEASRLEGEVRTRMQLIVETAEGLVPIHSLEDETFDIAKSNSTPPTSAN